MTPAEKEKKMVLDQIEEDKSTRKEMERQAHQLYEDMRRDEKETKQLLVEHHKEEMEYRKSASKEHKESLLAHSKSARKMFTEYLNFTGKMDGNRIENLKTMERVTTPAKPPATRETSHLLATCTAGNNLWLIVYSMLLLISLYCPIYLSLSLMLFVQEIPTKPSEFMVTLHSHEDQSNRILTRHMTQLHMT